MPRISIIAQVIAFPIAIITPLVCLMAGVEDVNIIMVMAGYPWLIGIIAAVWNRRIEDV